MCVMCIHVRCKYVLIIQYINVYKHVSVSCTCIKDSVQYNRKCYVILNTFSSYK